MIDKEILERVTLRDLDIAVIRGNAFEISKEEYKFSIAYIRACVGNDVNLFSCSKYGLKQAKRWIIESMKERRA